MVTENTYRYFNERRFYLIIGGLIVIAWGLLIELQISTRGEALDHGAMEHQILPSVEHITEFLFGWFLMTVGMMLPGSLPMLKMHIQPTLEKGHGKQVAGLIVSGYILPWILFGFLAYMGDSLVHWLFEPGRTLGGFGGWIAPAILLSAGVYQFTSFKRMALGRCRVEQDVARAHSVMVRRTRGWMGQGARLGMDCVMNCSPLMLVMFALGHNRLEWMVFLGTIMAAERIAPRGERIAWVVGVVLIACSVVWISLPG
jgi:predicted metal-binding membrane protein